MFTICMRCDPIRRCAPTSKDAAVGAQWRRAERNNRISSISMRSTGNVVPQTGNVIYSSPITAHVYLVTRCRVPCPGIQVKGTCHGQQRRSHVPTHVDGSLPCCCDKNRSNCFFALIFNQFPFSMQWNIEITSTLVQFSILNSIFNLI